MLPPLNHRGGGLSPFVLLCREFLNYRHKIEEIYLNTIFGGSQETLEKNWEQLGVGNLCFKRAFNVKYLQINGNWDFVGVPLKKCVRF